MKLCVFPNPLLFDWFLNNSFHLFTPYGDAKNDIKKKKKKNFCNVAEKGWLWKSQISNLMTVKGKPRVLWNSQAQTGGQCWGLCSDTPLLSCPGQIFLPFWFLSAFLITKWVTSIGPFQDYDVKEGAECWAAFTALC